MEGFGSNGVFKKEKNTADSEASFTGDPLTPEQRKELGVEQYYRPFFVNRKQVLTDRRPYWILKRSIDIACAVSALVILSPLIIGFLLAIYIDDPSGSPIFKQERIGRGGKPFVFYKMRSMCVDAEDRLEELLNKNESNEKAFKMLEDPRVTRIGKFIRNTSIDELPQLINIIKGDMTIVGPRPPLPREVALYDAYEMQRLTITPGLTCFWQVYPRRHTISFDDWVALDVKYIQERTFWVDVKLIWQTVMLILSGDHD